MGAALGCPALLDALEVHLLKLLTRRQALKVACLPIQARESLSTLQQLLHRRTGLPSCYVVYCAQSKNKLYVHSPMRNHLCYLVVRRWPCRGTRSGEQCAPGCAGDSAARPRRAARRDVRGAAAAGRAGGRARRLPHAPAGCLLCEQHAAGAGPGHRCTSAGGLSPDLDALHVMLHVVVAHGARAS